jgi:hypothetical protein
MGHTVWKRLTIEQNEEARTQHKVGRLHSSNSVGNPESAFSFSTFNEMGVEAAVDSRNAYWFLNSLKRNTKAQ